MSHRTPSPSRNSGPRTPSSSRNSGPRTPSSSRNSGPRTPSPSRNSGPKSPSSSRNSGPRTPSPSKLRKRTPSFRNSVSSNSDNGNSYRNTPKKRKTIKNVNSKANPYLIPKNIEGIPKWWNSFTVKLTHIIDLMDSQGYNYVIAGSSANALLTFFIMPELLSNLTQPDDGDFIIIPDDFSKVTNFRAIGLTKVGEYKTNKPDTKSSTFKKEENRKSENEFNSIDINLEKDIKYIIINGFKIISPEELNDRYIENFRDKNEIKRDILSQILESGKLKSYEIKNFTKKNSNNRRKPSLGFGSRLFME